jgi:hypothetical protein
MPCECLDIHQSQLLARHSDVVEACGSVYAGGNARRVFSRSECIGCKRKRR